MLCAKENFGISWLPPRCKQKVRQNFSSLHSIVCLLSIKSSTHRNMLSFAFTVIDWFVFFCVTTAFVCDQMGLIKLPTGCFAANI
jgi:hypothetical protein